MGSRPTKAADTIWGKARLDAAIYDGRFNSREKAAEIMGYHPSTVAGWELGNDRPSPEAVLIMSDTYNAPHLCNHYCAAECPLGKDTPALIDGDLDRLTLRLLKSLRDLKFVEETIVDIVADGVIDNSELRRLKEVLDTYKENVAIYNSLENMYQKLLKSGG